MERISFGRSVISKLTALSDNRWLRMTIAAIASGDAALMNWILVVATVQSPTVTQSEHDRDENLKQKSQPVPIPISVSF